MFSLVLVVQERYSKIAHNNIKVRNAKEVPPRTEITDEDLINEMHDIKLSQFRQDLEVVHSLWI